MFDGVHQMEPFGTHKILFCSCSTAAATWVQMQAKLPPAGITAENEKDDFWVYHHKFPTWKRNENGSGMKTDLIWGAGVRLLL